MIDQFLLDLSDLQSEEDFHSRVFRTFSFPSYYGQNKDAFWDCITDFIGDVAVEIVGESTIPPSLKQFCNDYLEMLDEYSEDSEGRFKVYRLS